MITEHKQMLQSIQAAEKQAVALKAEGESVDNILRALRSAGRQTAARISYYETAKKAEPKEPARAPKPAGEPK